MPLAMRRERSESEDKDDDIPLHHRRPFGAGLRRQKVEFVRATDAEAGITVVPEPSDKTVNCSIGDLYASVVLGGNVSRIATTDSIAKSSRAEDDEPPPPICDVCLLPITTGSLRQHEASLAHQVSLAHSHPPSALDRSRMGLRTLASQGWNPDSRLGLGRDGEGIRFPVRPAPKEDTLGIGATLPPKQEVREKPQPLTAKQRKALEQQERKRGERLQAEIYGRIDVERYLRGE